MTDLPPIYFYLPQKDWLDDMPEQPDVYWEQFGKGIYCWTLQTYLYLKADGFPCNLVGTIPDEGIVIAHRDSLPYELRPTPKVLMVCIKPDRNPHPYAQLQVVQNPQDAKKLKNTVFLIMCTVGPERLKSSRNDNYFLRGSFSFDKSLQL